MIASMRSCFSLFIVVTLLFVSSVPMESEAATCKMPLFLQAGQLGQGAALY